MKRIIHVTKYNDWDMDRYHAAVALTNYPHEQMPNVAFYGFRKRNGDLKQYGFVLYEHTKPSNATWYRTKKDAIAHA